jgi:predicted dehydrogenase
MPEPVGIALIGLGARWGRQLAAAVGRVGGLALKTCYARTAETRQTFAAEFQCEAAPSLEAALEAPGVEAAIVAAPGHNHAEIALACAERGLHALVEKPMADSVEAAVRMRDAFARAGRVLMVNHEMRRLGSSQALKQLVEAGRLGRVVAAMASLTLAGTFSPDNWRCHRETNRGGAMMQLGIHQIDTLMYLLGPVTQVQGRLAHVAAPVDVDDAGAVQLTFASGAVAAVVATFVSPKGYALHLYGDRANVDCLADMSVWPDARRVDAATQLTLQTAQGREPVAIEPQDCLALQLDEFARSVRGSTQPATGAAEGLAALAVVEAAIQSQATGQPVDPRSLA